MGILMDIVFFYSSFRPNLAPELKNTVSGTHDEDRNRCKPLYFNLALETPVPQIFKVG